VFESARDQNALALVVNADDFVALAVKADGSFDDVPERVLGGMRMEIVFAAAFNFLHVHAHEVAAANERAFLLPIEFDLFIFKRFGFGFHACPPREFSFRRKKSSPASGYGSRELAMQLLFQFPEYPLIPRLKKIGD